MHTHTHDNSFKYIEIFFGFSNFRVSEQFNLLFVSVFEYLIVDIYTYHYRTNY